MTTTVRTLEEMLPKGEARPSPEWDLRAVISAQCMSFVAWNSRTREALIVDPKDEDLEAYRAIAKKLEGYLWLGIFDSHTHADHISSAAQCAMDLDCPLVMHALAPSRRVDVRISRDTHFPSQAGPVRTLMTPGHTQDSITLLWGPFLFGGDTILNGDTGRDDLPGGNAEDHYASVQKVKAAASPEMILLPGHGREGTLASSWKTQLTSNLSLTQSREIFVKEASSYSAPSPALLKESLRENFK